MRNLEKSRRAAVQLTSTLILMLLITASASAYTIIMRDGRRVEIPANFTVTSTTLTYEVAKGIQITLQLATIDIPATEKANNESPGSLLRRAQSESLRGVKQAGEAVRSITNRDLEPSRTRRQESEQAYEVRRKELQLPSLEESRKQAAAQTNAIAEELQQKRAEENANESYWRARATALRTEIAAVEAELLYVRNRLEEGPFGWTGSFSSVTTVAPFISFGGFGGHLGGFSGHPGGFGRHRGNFGRHSFRHPNFHQRSVFVAPRGGPQLTGRVGFGGGATRGRVLINPGSRFHRNSIGFGPQIPFFPVAVFPWAGSYDFSYERSALITRFNDLAATRAGLKARWWELEEEARRAGVPPGWLRE